MQFQSNLDLIVAGCSHYQLYQEKLYCLLLSPTFDSFYILKLYSLKTMLSNFTLISHSFSTSMVSLNNLFHLFTTFALLQSN